MLSKAATSSVSAAMARNLDLGGCRAVDTRWTRLSAHAAIAQLLTFMTQGGSSPPLDPVEGSKGSSQSLSSRGKP